ncbi:MAG TPA: hypothetical protein VEJ22_02000 [Nitrospirota bacterium]|nr:hypothetical protein [Nitrospirota bacterium]
MIDHLDRVASAVKIVQIAIPNHTMEFVSLSTTMNKGADPKWS